MEIRKSYLDGSYSFITPKRKNRPHLSKSTNCPFCRGNEHLTPPTIIQFPRRGKWKIRVFRNKYPIVSEDTKKIKNVESTIFKAIRAYGYHEVVVDHYRHDKRFWDFTESHISKWLMALLKRYDDLRNKKGIKYVFIFKNYGERSAASIQHDHSQIIALPILPTRVKMKMSSMMSYYKKFKKCFLCELKKHNDLIIKKNRDFTLLYNPTPIIEGHMLIIPNRHFSDFSNIKKGEIQKLASIIKYSLRMIRPNSYNMAFFPFPKKEKHLHFHIEILPRKQTYGAMELALHSYVISSLL